MFCPFAFEGVALLAAQKAINAKRCSISVCAIGRYFLHGFAVEVLAILTPGVIGSWWLGLLELLIEGFGSHHFRLARGLLEEGIWEWLVFVEDGDFSFWVFTNGDLGVAQGIGWAVGLDLVDDLVELKGQVFRKDTGFLMSQDPIQVFCLEQGSVGVMRAAW
jgi:hypothetical protein